MSIFFIKIGQKILNFKCYEIQIRKAEKYFIRIFVLNILKDFEDVI